jgi:hypothetical protein
VELEVELEMEDVGGMGGLTGWLGKRREGEEGLI